MEIKAIYINDLLYESVPVFEYEEASKLFVHGTIEYSAEVVLIDDCFKLYKVENETVEHYSKFQFNEKYGYFVGSHEIDSE